MGNKGNSNSNGQIKATLNAIIEHIVLLRNECLAILDSAEPTPEHLRMQKFLIRVQQDVMAHFNLHLSEDANTDFVEFYIQTYVYVIFLALIHILKCNDQTLPNFNLQRMVSYIPNNAIIVRFFGNFIENLPSVLQDQCIKPIETALNRALPMFLTMPSELTNTFYSDFLELYDKKTRTELGAVYTPEPIVRYIIRMVDHLLKTKLNIAAGVLNPHIKILDPAAGTMSFACALLKFAQEQFAEKKKHDGGKVLKNNDKFSNWFQDVFLQNFYGFEILLTPYILGQFRVLMTAEELGISIDFDHDLAKMFMINALMDPLPTLSQSKTTKTIQIEQGSLIQQEEKITVVMGNPPYREASQNRTDWIMKLLKDYTLELNVKNKKIASDDYIKFFRLAHWKIQQNGTGIVAFITNNNYLDGITAEVMRKRLMETFNEIYVVNLHGNLRKGEQANPFNITVGVAIIFLVRTDPNYHPDLSQSTWQTKVNRVIDQYFTEQKKQKSHLNEKQLYQILSTLEFGCKLHYWDLNVPDLAEKYNQLNAEISEIQFQPIPITPSFYFMQKNLQMELKFLSFPAITELFQTEPRSGVMCGRESLSSNNDPDLLKENIQLIYSHQYDRLETLGVKLEKTKTWDVSYIFRKCTQTTAEQSIIRYNYGGFDIRYLIYAEGFVEGMRKGYLDLISVQNPAISITPGIRTERFSHALMTRFMPEKCFLAVKDSTYVFPLQVEHQGSLQPNIRLPDIGYTITEDQLFYYIYGILNANLYRNTYLTQLQRQFPRIPFPSADHSKRSQELFFEMCNLGKTLGNIHIADNLTDLAGFDGKTQQIAFSADEIQILDVKYQSEEQRIYLNTAKNTTTRYYIGPISADLWNFEIGSQRQLENWLLARHYYSPTQLGIKRHIGLRRSLSKDEMEQFLLLCRKIQLTQTLVPKIDAVYRQIDPDMAI